MSNFLAGFEKQAKLSPMSYAKGVGAAWGAVGGAAAGAGTGALLRSRFEEKFKEKKDQTARDKLLAKAPLIGGLGGLVAGGLYGAGAPKRFINHFIPEEMQNLKGVAGDAINRFGAGAEAGASKMKNVSPGAAKHAALRSDVKLKDHQLDALRQLRENDGSMLAAHATGTGKTLTGIAGFEQLKADGKGKRAIVVVPAGLRENFVQNLQRFTKGSTHAVFGPKGEGKTKNVGDQSSADYNIVSYELFREHGDKIIEGTGADTLIMDEIHRARGTEGLTYNKLRDLRPKFRNAITLTGSIVNNEPNDVVPLLDITFNPTGHKLVSKKFFDNLFVQKDAKTRGIFAPKVYVEKRLKNKPQLAKYIKEKVHFVSHEELEKDMPKKVVENVVVPMSKEQKKLYDYTLSSVDPITRWKIRNNIPVTQREAKDAFSKLTQARQLSTDPAVLDKTLVGKNPYDYSPKVKRVVDDLTQHLEADPSHKSVIFGNLVQFQLDSVEKALKAKGVPYAKFMGLGQEGQTAKTRPAEVKDFMDGKKRVMLISGAGAEGLDLKNTSMMQMLEGHYNPERIQQAEARVRRLGAFSDKAPEDRKVLIKRYMTRPEDSGAKKALGKLLKPFGLAGGDQGVDSWIYTIAEGKDKLNSEFRDVLKKNAAALPFVKEGVDASDILDQIGENVHLQTLVGNYGNMFGNVLGSLPAKAVAKRRDKEIEAKMKQMLLDRGLEQFTKKQHYDKIMAESKLDERAIDAKAGLGSLLFGLGMLTRLNPGVRDKIDKPVLKAVDHVMKVVKKAPITNPMVRMMLPAALTGFGTGLLMPTIKEMATTVVQKAAIGGGKDLDTGIKRYTDKMRKKIERKYKSSKDFVNEFETKQELGIDVVG